MAFAEIVYNIWLQRNLKIFSNKLDNRIVALSKIMFNIACRRDDEMRVVLIY